jgi:hypothetical protein
MGAANERIAVRIPRVNNKNKKVRRIPEKEFMFLV